MMSGAGPEGVEAHKYVGGSTGDAMIMKKHLMEYESADMRGQMLGEDSAGDRYFYCKQFDASDFRIYRLAQKITMKQRQEAKRRQLPVQPRLVESAVPLRRQRTHSKARKAKKLHPSRKRRLKPSPRRFGGKDSAGRVVVGRSRSQSYRWRPKRRQRQSKCSRRKTRRRRKSLN